MKFLKSKLGILLLAIVAMFTSFAYWYGSELDNRDWVRLNLYHRDYLSWKENGGEFKKEYYLGLKIDRFRDKMIADLTLDGIREKFPSLVPGDQFPIGTYKGNAFRSEKDRTKVLWFSIEDDFDWCIHEYEGEFRITLVKG